MRGMLYKHAPCNVPSKGGERTARTLAGILERPPTGKRRHTSCTDCGTVTWDSPHRRLYILQTHPKGKVTATRYTSPNVHQPRVYYSTAMYRRLVI